MRAGRLGFRVDAETKALVARAARLERRTLTDYCLTALTGAARRTVTQHETIMLSERDRAVFFAALANPRAPNARLRRAMRAAGRRIAR